MQRKLSSHISHLKFVTCVGKKGDVLFVVGNVDQNLALTRDLHINSVPHLSVWFQGKKRVDVHGPSS